MKSFKQTLNEIEMAAWRDSGKTVPPKEEKNEEYLGEMSMMPTHKAYALIKQHTMAGESIATHGKQIAERIRRKIGAKYVQVIDHDSIRHESEFVLDDTMLFEEATPMTMDDVKAEWLKVFPNSGFNTRAQFGNSQHARLFLTKDSSECANGIRENDPLTYSITFENGIFKENDIGLYVKPKSQYLALSREKMRVKTIKEVTAEKLAKRFKEVRGFVMTYANDLKAPKFDITTK